jgi:hypothetical protein
VIGNTAFLALITVFLLAGWLAGELSFLAPYKAPLFARHGWLIVALLLVLFFNLTAFYYHVARWLFLHDSGSKLLHLDRQLGTADAAIKDIRVQSHL